jgi:hypothetical protein
MNNLKFEVGKAYQTRDGRKAVCLTTTLRNDYPLAFQIDDFIYLTTIDGCDYIRESQPQSPKDIIGIWIDKPVIDWSVMPAWAKFVAMDSNGSWFWYTHKPSLEHVWCVIDGDYGKIPSEYAPKWDVDWRNSLIERP